MSADRSQAWRALAACAGLGPSLFYSEDLADQAAARSICATCPVASDCAAIAHRCREAFGVWGGEGPTESCITSLATVGVSDRRLVELFAAASPRCRAIDVLHRLDVSTASAYRYLARAIQLLDASDRRVRPVHRHGRRDRRPLLLVAQPQNELRGLLRARRTYGAALTLRLGNPGQR